MRNSAWRGIVNWQTKRRSNCTKFQRLAWMFITSRRRSWKPSEICPMFLKCLYLARIGRLDILWSVNKLARAVIKWRRACDRRLARLISYIRHTNDCRQYCHVGDTAEHCRFGLLQDSDFAQDTKDSKTSSGDF